MAGLARLKDEAERFGFDVDTRRYGRDGSNSDIEASAEEALAHIEPATGIRLASSIGVVIFSMLFNICFAELLSGCSESARRMSFS